MSAIAAVLKLRPSNVANRIGGRGACVLNAYDVQRSLEGQGTVVVCELGAPGLAPGVLRAAKHLDAVIGLSTPAYPRGEGPRPHAFFQDAVAAAEEAGYRLPMFLRAGPIGLPDLEEASLDEARRQVFEHVDAGFTEIALDVGRLDPAEGAAAVANVAGAALERELSVELVLRARDPETLAEVAGSLAAQGLRPGILSIRAAGGLDVDTLAAAAAPSVLGVDEPGANQLSKGTLRVSVGERFDRLVESCLPAPLRTQLDGWRAERGNSLRAALGHFHRELRELERPVLEKLEAFAYNEARELLEAAGARGTARRSVAFLGEHSGY